MHPKDAAGIENSVDPDQSAPSLIWVCTVCPDLSVRKQDQPSMQKNIEFVNSLRLNEFSIGYEDTTRSYQWIKKIVTV